MPRQISGASLSIFSFAYQLDTLYYQRKFTLLTSKMQNREGIHEKSLKETTKESS